MIVGVAIRKVVLLGHPALRTPAFALTTKEIASPDVQRLVEELAASMAEYEGVGIAANQVGESMALFVMGLEPGGPRHPKGIELTTVFNPEIRFPDKETETDWEGCLSVPGLRGQVERRRRVELSGLDRRGAHFKRVYEGFPARVIQHECDHLEGKVYLDRMKNFSSLSYAKGR